MKSELLKHCREALPMLTKIENDLKWLETEFNPAKATAEERMYAKYLSIISYRDFMDAAWWITKMFAPVEKEEYPAIFLFRMSSTRFVIGL